MTDSSESGPPPDTYEELMRATYRALTAHGYADLTLRKVAAESEKSRSLVHYHYDSKDALVVALLDYLTGRLRGSVPSEDENPAKRLVAFLDWIAFGPSEDGEAYFTAIFELRAQAPYDPEIAERLVHNYRFARDQCVAIIAEGIERGVFDEVDPHATATLLLNAIDGVRNLDLTLGTDETDVVLDALDEYVLSIVGADLDDRS